MSLSKRTVERLTRMAVMLENLPKERKVMVPVPGRGTVPSRFDLENYIECGTSACAIGFAMLHPWFRHQGLKMNNKTLDPINDEDFFNVTDKEYYYLFLPKSYVRGNRSDVSRRIRAFVKSGGVIPQSHT